MNKKLFAMLAVTTALISFPAHSEVKAGDTCVSDGGIMTRATDEMDDLLACVKGTWLSMVHGGPSKGAVVAYNLTSCPSGWTELSAIAGRTIIAAGQGTGLTARTAGDMGGEENHTMTLAELVPHTITWSIGVSDKGGSGNGYAFSDGAGGSTVKGWWSKTSNVAGGGQSFNVMMPWVALIYCQKQ